MFNKTVFYKSTLILSVCFGLQFSTANVFSQDNTSGTNGQDASALLDHYIQTLNYKDMISFDASNIKQFWIDKSVASISNNIIITLGQERKSVPLKIQLANVNEGLDCKVTVISDSDDIAFSIQGNNKSVLSSSQYEDDFIQYHIASSTFHLEKTPDFSFNMNFSSRTLPELSIKKIILSFSKNKTGSYLASPGRITVSKDDVEVSNNLKPDPDTFSIKGKRFQVFLKKKIILGTDTLETSVKIKNISDVPTKVYVGYGVYFKDNIRVSHTHYPYKNSSNVINVIEAKKGEKTIIVDSYPEWSKNCFLALNAKEDLSDLPNKSFVDGIIVDIKKTEDGHAVITMDTPLKDDLQPGTKLRVHGPAGAFFYTDIKVINPSEEASFVSSIKKDENHVLYDNTSFPKGSYYVKPLILSHSVNPDEENSILISDYSVSY